MPLPDDAISGTVPATSRLREDELLEIGGRIADVVRGGLPLASGLAALREELPYGRVRRALGNILRRLEAGETVEQVVARPDSGVPPHLQALIRAGLRSGRLGLLLERHLADARDAVDLRRQVLLRLAYPLLLLTAGTALSVFFIVWLVPQFKEIYEVFYRQTPVATAMLIDFSAMVIEHWPWFLAGPVVLAVVLWGVLRWRLGPQVGRRLLLAIPIAGGALRATSLAEFCRLLALLIEGDEPLPAALRMCGDATRDPDLRRDCGQLSEDVANGRALMQSARSLASIPPECTPFFRWDGDRDALADSLRTASEIFEARARVQLRIAAVVYHPLAIVFIAALAGGLALVLYWPMFALLMMLV